MDSLFRGCQTLAMMLTLAALLRLSSRLLRHKSVRIASMQ